MAQANGKLFVATAGGSSQKPSAIALLEVNSVDDLLNSEPEQWHSIRLSTKSKVCITNFTNQCFAAAISQNQVPYFVGLSNSR